MDPDTTLRNILEDLRHAKAEDMRDAIVENLEALAEWIDKGGFLPDARAACNFTT